jgi:hypothetical protein
MRKLGLTATFGVTLLITGVSTLVFYHRAEPRRTWDGSEGYGTVIGIVRALYFLYYHYSAELG